MANFVLHLQIKRVIENFNRIKSQKYIVITTINLLHFYSVVNLRKNMSLNTVYNCDYCMSVTELNTRVISLVSYVMFK